MTGGPEPCVPDYGDLIRRFVDRTISAAQFETQYLDLLKNDEAAHSDAAFAVLDKLFSDVDEYFVSPEASAAERREQDEALREHAAAALARLQQLGAK